MMTVSSRAEALLDRDYRTLTAVEWRVVAEAFPDEYGRLLVRLDSARGLGRASRFCRSRSPGWGSLLPFWPHPGLGRGAKD